MSLENGSLAFPISARSLPKVGPLPHVFDAYEAFPLGTYLIKPYAGRGHTAAERIFNYRTSLVLLKTRLEFWLLDGEFTTGLSIKDPTQLMKL